MHGLRGLVPKSLLAAALVLVALGPLAAAQSEPAEPSLTIDAVLPGLVPGDGSSIDLVVNWTYHYVGASAPAGDMTLAWTLECGEGSVQFVGTAQTEFPLEAGRAEYAGTARLPIFAGPDAIPLEILSCKLTGEAVATATTPRTTDTDLFAALVAYRGDLVVTSLTPSKMSGPQKMVRYPIELENLGNGRTLVQFDVVKAPEGGRWAVLLPDPVLLEPGQKATALVAVGTPYHNGYVTDSGNIELSLIARPAVDPDYPGDEHMVLLKTEVKGWYIPAPSPLALLAGLAAAVLLQRRSQS